MSAFVIATVCGFFAGRLLWIVCRGIFSAPVFVRDNYRGHRLPTAGGIIIVASLVLIEGVRSLVGSIGIGRSAGIDPARTLTLMALVGFALLGLIDDLAAVGTDRGFRGHVRSLGDGRLTTGAVKLLGGGFLALVLAGPAGDFGGHSSGLRAFGWLVCDALVIALSANLANLFDRAPGRVNKVAMACFALIAVGASVGGGGRLRLLIGPAVVVGAALALLVADLREHLMLGDAGANALGAVLGLSVVLSNRPIIRFGVFVGLSIMNALSEFVSFSRIIEAVPVLRMLDRFGTTPQRRAPKVS